MTHASASNSDADRGLPKQERVYRGLLAGVREGRYLPGDRLPGEVELAQRYGISRGGVRRALARLEDEGVVRRVQGSGTYVSDAGVPSPHARADIICIRSTGRLLTGEPEDVWMAPIREGILYEAMVHGWHVFDDYGTALRDKPLGDRLAGLIVVAWGSDDPGRMLAGVDQKLPRVVINRPSGDPDVPSILSDNRDGAYRAVSFLLSLGHQRVAMLGDSGTLPRRQRLEGYRQALDDAGIKADPGLIIDRQHEEDRAIWPESLRQMLRGPVRPTALFADVVRSGMASLHLLEILREEGYDVPGDLALIVYDDDPLLRHAVPGISFVRQPMAAMGREAVRTLRRLIRRDPQTPATRLLAPELIMRQSVAPPRSPE